MFLIVLKIGRRITSYWETIFFLYQSLALQKVAKGRFFFRKCNAFFKSPKKVSQIPWNLNKLLTVKGGKFKFKVQDSDLEYLFWRFDKQFKLSEKKLRLVLFAIQFHLFWIILHISNTYYKTYLPNCWSCGSDSFISVTQTTTAPESLLRRPESLLRSKNKRIFFAIVT